MLLLSINYKNIFYSWKESLAFFYPFVFYKILLVSLLNTFRAIKALFINAVPLIITILYFTQFEQLFSMSFYDITAYTIIGALWDYYSFLALRPSILYKNSVYFFEFSSKLFSYWAINILFRILILVIIFVSISYTSYQHIFESNKILYITVPALVLLKAVQEIGTLFIEDNGPEINKTVIRQTLLFILYQLPLIILWYLLVIFIESINFIFIFRFLGLADSVVPETWIFKLFYKIILIITFFVTLFLRSCVTSIYIKRIHERAGVYL